MGVDDKEVRDAIFNQSINFLIENDDIDNDYMVNQFITIGFMVHKSIQNVEIMMPDREERERGNSYVKFLLFFNPFRLMFLDKKRIQQKLEEYIHAKLPKLKVLVEYKVYRKGAGDEENYM